MTNDIINRMNDARDGPNVTCPSSRHAAMMAEALCKGEGYAMLASDPEHCGIDIAATVAALWECRAKLSKAQEVADYIEKLELEVEALESDRTASWEDGYDAGKKARRL